MSEKKKKFPKPNRDWVGLRVKTKRKMQNGWGIIPAGTVCEVTYKRGRGLHLVSPQCPHCGAAIRASEVSISDVELLEDSEK